MALFGFGKKKTTTPRAETLPIGIPPAPGSMSRKVAAKDVILRPRVTEKAASLTSVNVYAFDVRRDATKKNVADAVRALYKVTPLKVNVVNVKAKRVRMRRKRGFGHVARARKAYVFLKKGDSITLS